jgi:hypothetical protein
LDTQLGKVIELLHIGCIKCSTIFHVGQVNKSVSKSGEDETGLGDAGVARH